MIRQVRFARVLTERVPILTGEIFFFEGKTGHRAYHRRHLWQSREGQKMVFAAICA
jgi:hypothetical protein